METVVRERLSYRGIRDLNIPSHMVSQKNGLEITDGL